MAGIGLQVEPDEGRRLAPQRLAEEHADQRAQRVRGGGLDDLLLVRRPPLRHAGQLELDVVDVETGRRDVALLARLLDDVVLVDPTQLARAAHETDLVTVLLHLELFVPDVDVVALDHECHELFTLHLVGEGRRRHHGVRALHAELRLRQTVPTDVERVALDVDLDGLDGELVLHVELVETHLAVELVELVGQTERIASEEVVARAEAVVELSVTVHGDSLRVSLVDEAGRGTAVVIHL